MSCGLSLSMSNSRRIRWKLAEQTVIRVQLTKPHDVDDTATGTSDRDNTWPPNTPGAQEAEGDIQQLTPTLEDNTQGFENKCIIATKQQRGFHKYTLHQPKNTNSLRDTGNNTTHAVFEGEHAVKLHAKNVEVGISSDRIPRQDQVTMGMAHSPGSTNDQSLSFLIIQYHAPVIAPLLNPSQVPVN